MYQSRTWPKASGLSPACAFWVLILIWWMGRWDTTLLAQQAGMLGVPSGSSHNQAGLVQSNSCEAAGPSCTGPLAFFPVSGHRIFQSLGAFYDEQDGSYKLYTLRVSNPYLLSPNGVSRCIVRGSGSGNQAVWVQISTLTHIWALSVLTFKIGMWTVPSSRPQYSGDQIRQCVQRHTAYARHLPIPHSILTTSWVGEHNYPIL